MQTFIRQKRQPMRVHAYTSDEVMTIQSAKDETDVNRIVQRFQRTGELPPNPRGLQPQYVDCVPLQEDLTEALNKSHETIENFNEEQDWLAEQEQAETETETAPAELAGASPRVTGEVTDDPAPD